MGKSQILVRPEKRSGSPNSYTTHELMTESKNIHNTYVIFFNSIKS